MPMKLITLILRPASASSPKEPAVISGRENMTVKGWIKDSNCIAMTMYTSIIAKTRAMDM